MRRVSLLPLTVAALISASVGAYQSNGSGDLAVRLERIGDRVQQYYARTRSVVCLETVRLQPLGFNLSPDGHGRQLVYELRVSWEPGGQDGPEGQDGQNGPERTAEANVLRELLTVDGRPPKPKDEPGCLDPRPVSPEPLAMLLANRRREYVFTWAGTSRTDGRASVKLDYKAVASKPAEITWRDECVSVELPGRTRGRIWIDAETDEVLRLDEQLTGMFEFPVPRAHVRFGGPGSMIIERADSTIRYRPVAFRDPDETLMLPSSIESFTVVRNAGVPRLRTTQVFSNYTRFLTEGRIREPGER
jgi:hypothetical protein